MDWKEIQVRLAQEFHKRADLIRHQVGIGAGKVQIRPSSGSPSNFFFPANEARIRADLIRKYLPGQVSAIIHEADEICRHRFHLLGYNNLDYGPNIDWHLDRVHDKRAPLHPWFKIPFLDFAVVGDHKITWELNRHQHLVALAKAYLFTGNEKYSRELVAQWQSWIAANPYPLGINWGSSLEVAFRTLSWIWIDHLLTEAPEYIALRQNVLSALAFHGQYIERYLSTYFSPNTHLLGEAVALFFLGTLYPQMPRAPRWKQSGWEIVLHEANRQVRPDGVYFEQSLHYHVYALDFFLYARLLAAQNTIRIPATFDVVLQRMLAVVAALAQAGPPEGFGDDDGGRLFDPRRNRTEQTTDPLSIGAVFYSQEFPAAHLTEESVWFFGQPAVDQLQTTSLPRQMPDPAAQSVAFPDGGIYVLASAEPFAQTVVIDAGPQGVGRSGHGHADALSLRLTMNRQRWLVDSGSGVYIAKDIADRDAFRGTGAHNTLRVDGLDQAVAAEPFSWTHIPTLKTEAWVAGKTFAYFAGSHNGYTRLSDPVTHQRQVMHLANGCCLVRDVADGSAEHDLELRWHFAPDLELEKVSSGQISAFRRDAAPADAALTLLVPVETAWEKGTEMTRTLLSPAYGAYEPSFLVRSHARVKLPAESATAFSSVPVAARRSQMRLSSMRQTTLQVYEIDSRDQTQAFFFALSDSAWSFGPWSSDCRHLYCALRGETLEHLVLIGGTQASYQGQPLLYASGPSDFFEWRCLPGSNTAQTGMHNFSITPWFEKLAGSGAVSGSSPTFAEKH